MALVDYNSDSEPDASESSLDEAGAILGESQPTVKRRKLSTTDTSSLPPLPSTFHDLYAHTVRLSNTDDPSLHQGRKRQTPHIAGNWPSHLYIEWRPQESEHTLLSSLLAELSSRLGATVDGHSNTSTTEIKIQDFLTSDLGAPLPLHISLSRPLSLTTAQKDDFLDRLRGVTAKSGIGEFELTPTALEWHRTRESARSFLVLRVASSAASRGNTSQKWTEESNQAKKNAELHTLLGQCNTVCRSFGQAELYAFDRQDEGGRATVVEDIGDAFHASVAWSFALPTEELERATAETFATDTFRHGVGHMRIKVDGIKAKIGNVVTHLPIATKGTRTTGGAPGKRGLFGV